VSHIVAGKYELLRRLGKGGMAEVFLARQHGMDGFEKLVVIKRILPQLAGDDEFVTMFLDEARTAADLRHPNVVNIFEIGEDEGTYFMAMEFLHGQDIRRIQRKCVKVEMDLPLEHALQIAIDAAAGLHHAHTKADLSGQRLEIVHRDVSPQNIICTFDGATKIVDFGIAKAASQTTETQSGIVKGKYTYMSPEQALGEHIDARTDQFALGIVLWELLTMRRLFKRETDIATLTAITSGDVPPPGDFVADLPKKLDQIVVKSLAFRREERFDSCEDMAMALEDLLAEERRPHSPARLGGFLRKVFADELSKEQDMGVGRLDGESMSVVGAPATTVDRKGPSIPDSEIPTTLNPKRAPPSELDATRVEGASALSSEMGVSHMGSPTAVTAQSQPMTRTATAELEKTASIGRAMAVDAAERSATKRVILAAFGSIAFLLAIGAFVTWLVNRPQVGQIVVTSDPKGATVLVDGKPHAEKTPLILRDILVGEQREIVVKLEGYKPVKRRVTLATGGQNLKLPMARLKPIAE
jgi:serine/threonine protein kinase